MTRNWPGILSTFLRALGPPREDDADDMAVHVVLIALHKATRGEIDLAELAAACIACDGAAAARRHEATGRDGAGEVRP